MSDKAFDEIKKEITKMHNELGLETRNITQIEWALICIAELERTKTEIKKTLDNINNRISGLKEFCCKQYKINFGVKDE